MLVSSSLTSKPLNICLRFGNDRNVGWELTHDRAVEVLREADRRGLMHTAYHNTFHGGHGLCNCCTDCCFPILASRRLGTEAAWPVRCYVAGVDAAGCDACRRCTRRCPFGAITRPDAEVAVAAQLSSTLALAAAAASARPAAVSRRSPMLPLS